MIFALSEFLMGLSNEVAEKYNDSEGCFLINGVLFHLSPWT
jgi:hypothetical protein